jgi:peptidoglycan/xylan/chitin deacetylase (PgdA/CDA1 family)
MLGFKHDELAPYQLKLSARPTVVALMYHHFTTDKSKTSSVIVHRDEFRSQLRALKAAGFVSIRQQDLLAFLKGDQRVKLPEKSVIITIDDGYESNFELAYPILVQERFYASIFAVTSYRGKTPGAFPHFSWEQASEMYNSSYIDIQSHTDDLHYYGLTAAGAKPALSYQLLVNEKPESKFAYEKRIYADLYKSKSLIEQHVSNKVFVLTYPYGSYNNTVISRATAAGYSLMYTVAPGVIRKGSDHTKLPRVNVEGKYTAKELLEKIRSEIRKAGV